MMKVDMSSAAVTGRLKRVDELRDLCRVLAGPRLKYPEGVMPSKTVIKESLNDEERYLSS